MCQSTPELCTSPPASAIPVCLYSLVLLEEAAQGPPNPKVSPGGDTSCCPASSCPRMGTGWPSYFLGGPEALTSTGKVAFS